MTRPRIKFTLNELLVVTCRSRVICKKVASRSGTIGAQSENGSRTPRPKKGAKRIVLRLVRLQFSLCAPFDTIRCHSISFVKTHAPGGFPSSGTAVLTDFLQMTRLLQVTKIKLIFEFVSVFRLVFFCFTAPGPRKTQQKTKTTKTKNTSLF